MAESFLRHSPLAHLGLAARASGFEAGAEAGVTMGERPYRGLVNLRGPSGDTAFAGAVETALGVALPVEPNTTAGTGDLTVFWLGPDEWWVVTPGDGPALADKLRAALADQKAAVTDVSESRTCIHIRGPRARDLLAKGCPLDLHPRVFAAGQCAQSLCAKAMITLHQVADDDADAKDAKDAGPAYDVYVLNSFAEYLWLWLEDAAQEYGLRIASQ
ncbi:MAG: sarcosine oxidase subunit gamma family protein [Kiloniellales bacterium]|nr:sarcosine oxidase subunit gamma family protein [Kiloniellales bacterium]